MRPTERARRGTVALVAVAITLLGLTAEVALPVTAAAATARGEGDRGGDGLTAEPIAPTPTEPAQVDIVGGTEAPAGAWPSQVGLVVAGRSARAGQFCGGTLVSRTWVLTAAHCLRDIGHRPTPGQVDVFLGSHDLGTGGTRIRAVQFVIHPGWDLVQGRNDIALVRMDRPAPASIPFQALTAQGVSPVAGTPVTVTGWGVTSERATSAPVRLRQVTLDVATPAACAGAYPGYYQQSTMVCAARAGKDSCYGDSGGPLLVDRGGTWTQVGIVSTGEGCARSGYPGIYTKLAAFSSWVAGVIRYGPHADAGAFVDRMWRDAFNRPPTAVEAYSGVVDLQAGRTPGAYAAEVLGRKTFDDRTGAVVRLYQAIFRRRPDTGGMTFWWQRAMGGASVPRIAEQMVAAPEFRQTYGSLDDTAFVDLVYQNVLGRAPSAPDRAYWVDELRSGRRTRGRVMVGFSESPEYKGLTAGPVRVTGAFFALVRRVPTTAELATWQGSGWEPITTFLLASYAYAARF